MNDLFPMVYYSFRISCASFVALAFGAALHHYGRAVGQRLNLVEASGARGQDQGASRLNVYGLHAGLYCLSLLVALPVLKVAYFWSGPVTFGLFMIMACGGVFLASRRTSGCRFLLPTIAGAVFFFLICTGSFWFTSMTVRDGWIGVSIYDDLFPHLQEQNWLAFRHINGPAAAADGFPSIATKSSNVMTFLSGLLVKTATFGDATKWSLGLGHAAIMAPAMIFLGALIAAVARLTSLRKSLVIGLLPAAAMRFGTGPDWYLVKFVDGINNGMSIAIFCLVLLVAGEHYKKSEYKSTNLILLCSIPLLVWSRMTWVPFYGLFMALILICTMFSQWENKFDLALRAWLRPVQISLCLAVAALTLLVISNNRVFGVSPVSLTFSRWPSFGNLGTYSTWTPNYHFVISRLLAISPFLALGFAYFTDLIAACGAYLFWPNRMILISAFIANSVFSTFSLFVVPFSDSYAFGSSEPLVSFSLIKQTLMCVAIVLPAVKLVKLPVVERIMGRLTRLRFGNFALNLALPVTLVPWLVFGANPERLSESRKIHMPFNKGIVAITKMCQSGEIVGVGWYHPGLLGGYLESTAFVSSLLGAATQCMSIGEARYSRKLSATEDRKALQAAGERLIASCLAGLKQSGVPRVIDEDDDLKLLRRHRVAVVTYDGTCVIR